MFVLVTGYEPILPLNCRVVTLMIYDILYHNIISSLVIDLSIHILVNQIFHILAERPFIKLYGINPGFEYRVPIPHSNHFSIHITLLSGKMFLPISVIIGSITCMTTYLP